MDARASVPSGTMRLIRQYWAMANNPAWSTSAALLVWLGDCALCGLIIKFIEYTEIDWKAYMQQVAIYLAGERDYAKIYGDTGPLVYPGGHVYIYRILYAVTNQGEDIRLAQWIFAGLYLATLALVMLCYREARAPPILFPLLCLSKRMHSIFMLRLFNDGFAVFFFFLAIFLYQNRQWTLGSVAYSFGLSVKMSLLLALPAIGVVLWQARGRNQALKQALIMGQLQILLGHEFLFTHASSYLGRAFEFSRQFMFKWTVNWRFVGEDMFLSREFSTALLTAHATLLIAFISTVWLKPSGLSFFDVPKTLRNPPAKAQQDLTSNRVRPDFILHAILSSVIIGCLCARSLHYQFYTYIVWATPFLLWKAGLHPVLVFLIFDAQEWAWNVYPSTNVSSGVVVAVLAAAVAAAQLGGSRLLLNEKATHR